MKYIIFFADLVIIGCVINYSVAGGVSTNINNSNRLAGFQNHNNNKDNVERSKTDFYKFAPIHVETEKHGHSSLSSDSKAKMDIIEDSHFNNNNNDANVWIYQHGFVSNPFKNARFAEGENSRKRFKKQ